MAVRAASLSKRARRPISSTPFFFCCNRVEDPRQIASRNMQQGEIAAVKRIAHGVRRSLRTIPG